MRIFSISDLHVDFSENMHWCEELSCVDYQKDILILAGDITDVVLLFEKALRILKKRFLEVLFVPGNHDLWVRRNQMKHSLEKLQLIKTIAVDCGVRMEAFHISSVSIFPLYAWYDYSFKYSSSEIVNSWMDYIACKWPENYNDKSITQHFIAMNEEMINESHKNQFIISFSHFLPRIDIMPWYIPQDRRKLYPVLGTILLEKQIRRLGSKIHVYGHSHVNHQVVKDNILYINNAFGYPYETEITAKKLKCIFQI